MTTTLTPGVYPTLYPPATFYVCPQHPSAEALVVLVITEDSGHHHDPLCAECGSPLTNWDAALDSVHPPG